MHPRHPDPAPPQRPPQAAHGPQAAHQPGYTKAPNQAEESAMERMDRLTTSNDRLTGAVARLTTSNEQLTGNVQRLAIVGGRRSGAVGWWASAWQARGPA